MKRDKKTVVIGLIVIVSIGLLLSWAGGSGSVRLGIVPVFAVCGFLAFLINWLAFIPANAAQTEKYYDLTGSLTYLTLIVVALLLSGNTSDRALIVAAMVAVWAMRLGSFLFLRIRSDGADDRFDEIKVKPLSFFFAWTLQALWVLFTAAAALAVITSEKQLALGVIGTLGIAMWVTGFLCEVIADAQKRRFKQNPDNRGRFIQSGLWSWSRHPNYFGEILLWSGVAVIAIPILQGPQWLTLISPVFVYLLLTRVSGIPLLAEKGTERWGDDPAYQAYVENTPRLIPMPPRKSDSN
ncbi:DUF1295 domain-containing protein [Arenicella xantha]|uniref:Steroid 5-alpha reductase family enzyme n=1 Tax=Arenicella xantha TaxID=644221 RepID=A0A395JG90_9GAMM|nr:DUF1295 domain-containing protein [Arenicella xantha]RBP48465.1 steroid 5-alpha reductase family enzyme [Arenicella xantha]